MWDVYLGGLADNAWREKFKNEIAEDISVFDPMVDNYDDFSAEEISNQSAKELIFIQEKCAIVVFYINGDWQGANTLIQLGDAVGRGKQVVVCVDGEVKGAEKIRRYCEFQGVPLSDNLQDLVVTVESYMGELALCSDDELVV